MCGSLATRLQHWPAGAVEVRFSVFSQLPTAYRRNRSCSGQDFVTYRRTVIRDTRGYRSLEVSTRRWRARALAVNLGSVLIDGDTQPRECYAPRRSYESSV